jgi:hypothetical protein
VQANQLVLLRCLRVTRGFKWPLMVAILRSSAAFRAFVDGHRCLACCFPPTAEEVAAKEAEEREARQLEEALREESESAMRRLSEGRDGSLPPVYKPGLVEFVGVRGTRYGDGSVYQGEWAEGLEEGVGQMSFPTGDTYKGNFRRGLKQGRGLYLFKGGDSFRGSFMTNKKHGPGVYTWKDGDIYEANFEHGKVGRGNSGLPDNFVLFANPNPGLLLHLFATLFFFILFVSLCGCD